jgi:hypothetical protein
MSGHSCTVLPMANTKFHVLKEGISVTHVWVKRPDGLFDTEHGDLRGYAFSDADVVACRLPRKKHNMSACLGVRFNRFEVSWLHRKLNSVPVPVTRFMSTGELSDLLDMKPESLSIKGLS